MVKAHLALDEAKNVVLAIAAIHPGETVIHHALRELEAADRLELLPGRRRIRRHQIHMIEPVGPDARGRTSATFDVVAYRRVNFETQPLGRHECHAFGDAWKTGFARDHTSPGAFRP